MKTRPFQWSIAILAVGLTASLLVGRHRSGAADNLGQLRSELSALTVLDPGKDLTNNINRKDFRFLSYCGYACTVIGIEAEMIQNEKELGAILERCGTRDIKGTSDVIEPGEYEYLSKIATAYIIRYNRLLLQFLKENRKMVPNQAL